MDYALLNVCWGFKDRSQEYDFKWFVVSLHKEFSSIKEVMELFKSQAQSNASFSIAVNPFCAFMLALLAMLTGFHSCKRITPNPLIDASICKVTGSVLL